MSALRTTSDLTGRTVGGRKLIAVVYADMVGYSRLIGLDDASTLRRLRTLRRGLINPAIREHGGRVVHTGGDSLLVAFDSIEGAVRCAIKVQQQVPIYDGDRPPEHRIRFRIGINIGDVIPDGTDVHGEGVNIAARLQAECPVGGICVSRTVRDHVRDRLELPFEAMGALKLKNIARPVEAFVLRLSPTATQGSEAPLADAGYSPQLQPPALALPDEPSLAVLPFYNISGDPEQEYFADGIVEELITALSRVRWLFVIARNSSFAYKGKSPDVRQVARELGVRYVLEGSVRKAANRIRITGQLIDATTGAHIWADRFDGELADIFDLQDEVTTGVVAAIEPKLRDAEIERAQRRSTTNLQAYDLVLRALPSLYTLDAGSIARAVAMIDQAIMLDPNYARALALKARLQVRRVFTIGADPSAALLADTVRLARLAVEKGRDDPEVLWMASFAVALAGADLQGGMALIKRSLALNPHCAEALAHAAMISAYSGDRPATITYADRALRLNPVGRAVYNIFFARSLLDFVGADYAGCLYWTTKSLQEMPEFAPALQFQAASLSHLGRHDEARDVVRKLRAVTPEATISRVRSRSGLQQKAGFLDTTLEGLRQAGLPEE